jgi:hypothetical protein
MLIVLYEIFDALARLGYEPKMNESETGYTFNFNLELAICRYDGDSNVVTVMVPCVCKTDKEEDYSEAVKRVNSRNHIGRLAYVDDTAVSAVSSFLVYKPDGIESQVSCAIDDLNRLIEDFYRSIL